MASVFLPRNQNLLSILLLVILCSTMITSSSSTVILHWKNVSLSFEDMGANFAPPVNQSGECGVLYLADPLDACLPLRNEVQPTGNSSIPFVLIVRGGCRFEDKVRRAQKAGFRAAIVYDNENSGNLITMAGNSVGIDILAVFISKASGENLRNYVGLDNEELWLIPSFDNSAWSIIAISIIFLLSIAAVLAVSFFVRRHGLTYQTPQLREFHGMSSKLVKAMPSLVFTTVLDGNSTSVTCAICLEDYNVGDKIRILPCKHKFHSFCVDCWLTAWRTFCPVCKQDAETGIAVAPASESTPLLAPVLLSIAASPLSSVRSSSAIQIIASASPGSHPSSLSNHSLSTSSRVPRPAASHQHHTSPMVTISQSFMDVQNLPLYGSFAPMGLLHSSSFRYSSISPQNSQSLLPPYSHGSIYASSGYLSGHSSQHLNLLHYTESSPSLLSPYGSAQSLPGCGC